MIRVGLVSFGMASRVFHAPLISAVDGLALVAVVERHSQVAQSIYPQITTYPSLEAMLIDQTIELIVIATPNPTHAPLAHQALSAGRHVVVDKPAATASNEIRSLIELAAAQERYLIPFHNRRWDSDFQTLRKLLSEQTLGTVIYLESTFDRWRPQPRLQMWKESGDPGGGNLLDLGTHIADQAIQLFGLPPAISADVTGERTGARTDDTFTLRLHYPDKMVVLSANCLACLPRPRFYIRGTQGNFVKHGVDPQEARLKDHATGQESSDTAWGEEPASAWGTLAVAQPTEADPNAFITHRVESLPGDYRLFYAGVRDAMLGTALPPVAAIDAWRVARLLEYARESAATGHQVPCGW